ncbi:MAG: TIM-barrel domain-containing protein [Saprospiraceae bacterium]
MKKYFFLLFPTLLAASTLLHAQTNPAAKTVLDSCLAPEPDWVKNANIYEVNLRQYTAEGTFDAFAKHLPRLREMGVDILWFMPIQPIGVDSRKGTLGSYYSIRDYTATNPEHGSLKDFKKLVERAHALGMKVVLDWVANHTARDHEWTRKHPDWYVRDANGVIVAPFDWTDVAELNYDQPALRQEMIKEMLFWVRETDLDGFRCDVAGDVPGDFWEVARSAVEAVKPVWFLAENADQLHLLNRAFNANYGWPFHHLMNEVAKGKKPASAVFDQMREMGTAYPKGSYAMHFITNHDENSWQGTEYERLGASVEAFSVLYYTVPGMPLIYSGQESAFNRRLQFFEKDPIDWGAYSLAPFYTKLNAIKRENPALGNGRHGGFVREIKHEKPDHVVAFSRAVGKNKVLVVLNLSNIHTEVSMQVAGDAGVYREFFSNSETTLAPRTKLNLKPWEYRVYVFEKEAPRPVRTFESLEKTGNGLRIRTNDGSFQITTFTENAFEIAFEPKGETNPPSNAVGTAPQKVPAVVSDGPKSVEYITNGLSLIIQKSPFHIEFRHKKKPLFAEEAGYFDDGIYRGFRFRINESEQLLGGGERVLGMNRRGKRLKLYNRPSYGYEQEADLMYYSMPIAISSKKYMLVFDNGASGWLDLGATDPGVLSFEAVGGRMSYLVAAADQWPELVTTFTGVTGRQPMPPRWVLGNIASRMGYHTQAEVEAVAERYLEDNIPLDAVVLDLFWFGPDVKGHVGNLDWYRDSFPDPEKMMAGLKKQGVKTVLITEPFILKNTKTFDEATRLELVGKNAIGKPYLYDFYFGNTALLDIFKPETKNWFWEIYKKHTLSGVDGWWGDLGEPEMHPDDLLHVNGRADHVHNLYGHEWAKTVFEGFQKDFPRQRPVILMRSGFVGSQRYGMIPWSGDVNRFWGGLKPQVEIALSMGMQGLAYMHSDLGGFAGKYRSAELYTRWLQYGAFQPVFRTHAQEDVPAEPVFWDDSTKNIARRYIQLRYDLLPYNYTLLWENNTTGLPMMRPLCYADDDPALLTNTTTYLWGNDFLVSPVVEKGATVQTVHFPKGATWLDYQTGKSYTGGQTVQVPVTIQDIPVFVRAGAFVPMSEKRLGNTDDYAPNSLAIHYYHHPTATAGTGTLYEDDGKTPDAFAANTYWQVQFTSTFADGKLTLRNRSFGFEYAGKPKVRSLQYVIHGLTAPVKTVKLIRKDGKERLVPVNWRPEDGKPLSVFVVEGEEIGVVIE